MSNSYLQTQWSTHHLLMMLPSLTSIPPFSCHFKPPPFLSISYAISYRPTLSLLLPPSAEMRERHQLLATQATPTPAAPLQGSWGQSLPEHCRSANLPSQEPLLSTLSLHILPSLLMPYNQHGNMLPLQPSQEMTLCFFQWPMSPRARREGAQLFLFPIALLYPPIPLMPANLPALSKLKATHPSLPQAATVICQAHTHSTKWKALLLAHCPSISTPIITCQQNGHCANSISAHHVLSILL